MPRPISVTLSLPALRHNLACMRGHLHGAGQADGRKPPFVWAVIKANAYGHGIEQGCQAFEQADGLAMLDLNEAVRCRQAGWQKPILLLEGFFEPRDLAVFQEHQLTAVLHSQAQLDMLSSAAAGTSGLPVWLKLNTGMNRLGFAPAQFARVFDWVRQAQGKILYQGTMTHFARADDSLEVTQEQLACFQQTLAQTADEESLAAVSVCNSAACLLPDCWTALPAAQEQWVRIGICLYGASPFAVRSAGEIGLLPAMTLRSEIIGVQHVRKGEGIGYGHTFCAEKNMRVGVVACGYADGYPRHAPNGTPVSVMGMQTRLLGRVSMDMMVVDLSDIPQAGVGSAVTLWGEDGPGADDVARASGTIAYELLCAVAPRVPRVVQS